MAGKSKWRLQVCVGGEGGVRVCVCVHACVFIFLMWDDNIKEKIQVSKLLVIWAETQSYNSLFDNRFSPRPNSCCILLESALSDLLCLLPHFPVTEKQEREATEAGFRCFHGKKCQSGKARELVSGSVCLLRCWSETSSESSDQGERIPLSRPERGRDYHIDPVLVTLSTPVPCSLSGPLMCIDWLVLTQNTIMIV